MAAEIAQTNVGYGLEFSSGHQPDFRNGEIISP